MGRGAKGGSGSGEGGSGGGGPKGAGRRGRTRRGGRGGQGRGRRARGGGRRRLELLEGITPRADLGQSFLLTPEVLERSVEYAGVGPQDTVLEVGPGPGNLTELLLSRARRVVAVEVDRQFEAVLGRLHAAPGNLQVIWGDALEADWPPFHKLVANLPYQVALPVILRAVEEHRFDAAVVVVQHRLARRLAAGPGEEGYSRLSVTVQRLASVRLLEVVKRRHFIPPPDVDSAMLRLRPMPRPRFAVPSEQRFRLLLDFLFVQRERTVERAFLRTLGSVPPVRAVLDRLPEEVRRSRPAELPPEGFGEVAAAVHAAGVPVPAFSDAVKRKAQKLFADP